MPRIIDFEGRRIQVPDDATDADIESILSEAPATAPATAVAQPEAAAIPQEPSLIDTIMGYASTAGGVVDQGVRGIANGVISLPSVPNSMMNAGADLTGWTAKKLGAPEAETDAATAIYKQGIDAALPITYDNTVGALERFDPAPPDNFAERAANKIGEYLGGAVVPAGATLGAAERMGQTAAREMAPGFVNNMVKKAAADPRKFIADEAIMNAAAGTGAAVANQFSNPDTFTGQVLELLGSLAGPGVVGIGRATTEGVKQLAAAYTGSPDFAAKTVADSVTDTIMRNSDTIAQQVDPANPSLPIDSETLIKQIMAGKEVPAIPGFRPTTADAASDPALGILEASRARNNPGLFTARSTANATAADNALSALAPKENPGTAREAIQIEIDRRIKEAVMGQDVAENAATAALGPLTPAMTAAQRGNTVRTALESAEDAAKRRVDEAYQAVDLGGRQVDYSPLPTRIEDVISGLTPTEQTLAPVDLVRRTSRLGVGENVDTGILDAQGNPITRQEPAPAQPLKAANDLRSELGRMASAARADWRAERGGNNAARVISQLQEQVDGFIGQNLTPDEQTQLAAAKAQLQQMKDDFTRQGDPIAGVLARNDGGAPKVRDDLVAGKLAQGPTIDRLFGYTDSPDVRTAMREEILSKGQFDTPEKIAAFRTKYADELQRLPGLVDEIQGASDLRVSAQDAAARRQQVERDVGPNSVPGRYQAFSNEKAGKAMRAVFEAKDQAAATDELITFVNKDPKAVEGLRAAFWEELDAASRAKNEAARTGTGEMPLVAEKMLKFLDDPSKASVAEKLYADNPEHLANIRTLAETMRGLNTAKRTANAVNPSGTELTRRGSNVTMAEVGSKLYQVQIGRVSPAYVGAYIAGKIARTAVSRQQADAFSQLLDKALVDPDVAANLLRENNPATRAALTSGAKTWLGTTGVNALNALMTDPLEEDETKAAVMRGQ